MSRRHNNHGESNEGVDSASPKLNQPLVRNPVSIVTIDWANGAQRQLNVAAAGTYLAWAP